MKNASEGRKQIIAKLDRKLFNYTTKGKLYNSAKSIFNNHRQKIIFSISTLVSSAPYIAHDIIMKNTNIKYTEYLLLVFAPFLSKYMSCKVIDRVKDYFGHDNNRLTLEDLKDKNYIYNGILTVTYAYAAKQLFDIFKTNWTSITKK